MVCGEISLPSFLKFTKGEMFEAEFCGGDELGFAYIRKTDLYSLENYTNLGTLMSSLHSRIAVEALPLREISPGKMVTVKEGETLHRAKVVCLNDDGLVTAFLIDEGFNRVIYYTQIHQLVPELAKIPAMTIRCKIIGIEEEGSVTGEVLEIAFMLLRMGRLPEYRKYTVQVLSFSEGLLEIIMERKCDGTSFFDEVRAFCVAITAPEEEDNNSVEGSANRNGYSLAPHA